MSSIKILHIGDMHIDHDPKFKAKIQPSLDQIVNHCKEIKINAVIIPGDLTHRKQSYAYNSGIPMLINFLSDLSELVDFVFITKGNHDEPGSIALLHQLKHNIYSYEYPVCLSVEYSESENKWRAWDMLRDNLPFYSPNYIVSLVPYPSKGSFLSDDSIDNNNADFLQKFEQIFELIGDTTKEYACPKLLGFHGNVVGTRLSSGQTLISQDIMVAPSTIEKAGADYYALNHIHLRQEIKPNMVYAGGIVNFNWGETEQKSFDEIEFIPVPFDEKFQISREVILLTSARPMVKLEAEFVNGEFILIPQENINYSINGNDEIRFRCKVKENERGLITEEKIAELKKQFGEDVKIELNVIPSERESRSEEIMKCTNLSDEVAEYAAVINEKLPENIVDKVALVEGVEIMQEESL